MKYINTLRWFSELSQVGSAETGMRYCMPAVKSLEVRLKNAKLCIDDVPELCFAAAVIAFYRYSLTAGFPDFSYLRAGDVTLRRNKEDYHETLDKLLAVAISDAMPYLKTSVKIKCIGGGNNV